MKVIENRYNRNCMEYKNFAANISEKLNKGEDATIQRESRNTYGYWIRNGVYSEVVCILDSLARLLAGKVNKNCPPEELDNAIENFMGSTHINLYIDDPDFWFCRNGYSKKYENHAAQPNSNLFYLQNANRDEVVCMLDIFVRYVHYRQYASTEELYNLVIEWLDEPHEHLFTNDPNCWYKKRN